MERVVRDNDQLDPQLVQPKRAARSNATRQRDEAEDGDEDKEEDEAEEEESKKEPSEGGRYELAECREPVQYGTA